MEEISGILCIYKPLQISSHTVVSRVRGITKIKKAGHGGTLDPLADGVLPVLLGRATKISDYLLAGEKTYRAELQLGLRSDTCDLEGDVLEQRPVDVSAQTVRAAVSKFVGTLEQTPPMYSAVRVGGLRLYEFAREGIEVERQARQVSIYSIETELMDEIEGEYSLLVHCSKGTYIRTLVDDIGQALGCGAVLTKLTRTNAAGLSLADCVTLEELPALVEQGTLSEKIISAERYFSNLPRMEVVDFHRHLLQNGCAVALKKLRISLSPDDTCTLYGKDGIFLGLGRVVLEDDIPCMRLQARF